MSFFEIAKAVRYISW